MAKPAAATKKRSNKSLVKNDESKYLTFVDEAKQSLDNAHKDIWRVAELAKQVEIEYGKKQVAKFAADIGLAFSTVRAYRNTITCWPKNDGRPSFLEVAATFNSFHSGDDDPQSAKSIDKRYALVASDPSLKLREARELMKEWRDKTKPVWNADQCANEAAKRLNSFFAGNSQLNELIDVVLESKEDLEKYRGFGNLNGALTALIERLQDAQSDLTGKVKQPESGKVLKLTTAKEK